MRADSRDTHKWQKSAKISKISYKLRRAKGAESKTKTKPKTQKPKNQNQNQRNHKAQRHENDISTRRIPNDRIQFPR